MPPLNPFAMPFDDGRWIQWSRQREVTNLVARLVKYSTPQNIPLIGETFSGKSAILKWLKRLGAMPEATGESSALEWLDLEHDELSALRRLRFIFFNAKFPELAEAEPDQQEIQFWYHFHQAIGQTAPAPKKSAQGPRGEALDTGRGLRLAVENELKALRTRNPSDPLIVLIDNIDSLAYLPDQISQTLREFSDSNLCRYVVATRHPLYLLKRVEANRLKPSPFDGIFTDPIYLALLTEAEARQRILGSDVQPPLKKIWREGDVAFLLKHVGRHPEVLRRGCLKLFDERTGQDSFPAADTHASSLNRTFQLCRDLLGAVWDGLADPELDDLPRSLSNPAPGSLAPFQDLLIRIVRKELREEDANRLHKLELRGVVWKDLKGSWHLFSCTMDLFVEDWLAKRNNYLPATSPTELRPGVGAPPKDLLLTGQERKVYDYLFGRLGVVCSVEEIWQAVWGPQPFSKAAVQKVIERIRRKILNNRAHPFQLIVVRRKGYMLTRY